MMTCDRYLAICFVPWATMLAAPAIAQSGSAVTDPVPTTTVSATRSYTATIVRVPMRDGTMLAANLVLPGGNRPVPVIVSITPYGRHALHSVAAQYALAGLGMLAVDTRGRGDSDGVAHTFVSDIEDTVDVAAWVGKQPWSNGKIAMWGASYGGYNQWMASAKRAPGLVTITPAASVWPGRDFPRIGNVGYPYMATWTGFTKGRMAAFPLFGDRRFWREAFSAVLATGTAFRDIDRAVGLDSGQFDEWNAHPNPDSYWDRINPSDSELAAIDLPILSITGLYDGAQLGALHYYRKHMALASSEARARHYLVIGPYDHAGVGFPTASVGGLPVPDRGGMVPVQLNAQWFGWTMLGGPKPAFLRDRVMYYVMGANEWRAAPSLDAIPITPTIYALAPSGGATAVARAGSLSTANVGPARITYRFDPRDVTKAGLGTWYEGNFALHDADVKAIDGDGFVFESAAFAKAVEVIGTPKFEARIGIDTPDADFRLRLYEVRADGSSVYLSESRARARYRLSPREPLLSSSSAPQRYVFEDFSFVSRRLDPGSRLRFVLDPPNSIYIERNYNAAKPVAEQTPADGLVSTVTLVLGGRDGARLTIPMRDAVTATP